MRASPAAGIEQQYLDSLKLILDEGEEKHPERKLEAGRKLSHHTRGVTDKSFTHYMDDGFPLFTHKKMGLKSIAAELEFFIKGLTDKQWLKNRGCNIWNDWANPADVEQAYDDWYYQPWLIKQEEIQNSQILYITDPNPLISFDSVKEDIARTLTDLGPIYGYQWRHFNLNRIEDGEYASGSSWGIDQLKNLIDTLKSTPDDRRMVVSAWNPNQFNIMALPPCHIMWGVSHHNGNLDFRFIARSTDALYGWPYNIASYAMLFLLIAKETNLKARKFSAYSFDYHLYSNQFDAAKEAISRPIYTLPKIELGGDSIFTWTYKDFKLIDYVSNPPLTLSPDVVV